MKSLKKQIGDFGLSVLIAVTVGAFVTSGGLGVAGYKIKNKWKTYWNKCPTVEVHYNATNIGRHHIAEINYAGKNHQIQLGTAGIKEIDKHLVKKHRREAIPLRLRVGDSYLTFKQKIYVGYHEKTIIQLHIDSYDGHTVSAGIRDVFQEKKHMASMIDSAGPRVEEYSASNPPPIPARPNYSPSSIPGAHNSAVVVSA